MMRGQSWPRCRKKFKIRTKSELPDTFILSLSSLSPSSFRLEREVGRWDDSENDIIQVVKRMCSIMMDLSDFAKYVTSHYY